MAVRAGALILAAALAADSAIAPFSPMPPGPALPAGWRALHIARVAPSEISLATDEGATVLRVHSHASTGSAAFALDAPVAGTLAWRWKIDRVVAKGELEEKHGDDFAARVYVF